MPKRQYTLEELRLNNIDAASLLSPKDKSLDGVRSKAQLAALAGLCAYAASLGLDDAGQALYAGFGLVFTLTLDAVGVCVTGGPRRLSRTTSHLVRHVLSARAALARALRRW